MITKPNKNNVRQKRHLRIRKDLFGTEQRPRLNVFRSNKHIYAQLIDDVNNVTLASASTVDKELNLEATGNVEAAKQVGELMLNARSTKASKVLFLIVVDIYIMVELNL